MRDLIKYQLPPLFWILVIYFVSAIPFLRLDITIPPGTDKIVHAGVYFVLCWLTRRAFYHQNSLLLLKKSALLGAFIFTVVYSGLDEFHQSFIPGRTTDLYDLVADFGGALLFVAIAWILTHQDEDGDSRAHG